MIASLPGVAQAYGERITAPAIAMYGQPAMPSQFRAFAYANPEAPKGGRLTTSELGTFDSLNPFIIKGAAPGFLRNKVYESLMVRAYDEPFTLYPLIARNITTDRARSFVEFSLHPKARFSDGSALTSADVLFSFELLKAKGRPNYRLYYGKVAAAEAPDPHTVRFTFSGPDPELALIMGLMPILSSRLAPEEFEEGGLTPLLGSGPYRIHQIDAGASITLKRDPEYWGRDLPVNRGMHNFDTLHFIYFRDANSEFEAFKKGVIDARFETDPTRWQTGYVFPAIRAGAVVQETIPIGTPRPYSALVFNTRRPLFADMRVRQALIELFDFEWLNRNFYYGLYARTGSFFQGSHLSALNQPANALERELLAPFEAEIVPNVLEGTYHPPISDGSGRDRTRLLAALQLLETAGWVLRDQHLVHATSGHPFVFEIMVATREQERLALAYANQLSRAGISARVRYVDSVQFNARRKSFDFDMAPNTWQQSLSPGNEQAFYFSSDAADQPGTRNYMGMRSAAADAAIKALVQAKDEGHFVAAARALDRALISGAYAIPLFHTPGQWLARWKRIAHPKHPSLYGTMSETWWRVPGE
ncbi:extracellular solute-binding protein [Xanthobacter sp. TB0139]|uniref:extracellular solute-binding protein n=1 Tax=Xanthobacter sp. TB0139 TaxID=3459178 RepID=UPI004039A4F9